MDKASFTRIRGEDPFSNEDGSAKEKSCPDPHFHDMLQFHTYLSVYSNKKLVQHRWADWSHISKQEDLKSVIPLFESCKLTPFYGFQHRYDENIIREFYATLYIPEDKMKWFWMFRGFKKKGFPPS
jgi:hypothetical protein